MNYETELEQDLIQGNNWEGMTFTVTNSEIDYTEATIRAQFRESIGGDIFLTKEITPEITSSNEINFTFDLTAAESKLLESPKVYTDIEITTPTTRKTPILITFTMISPITTPV